MQLERTPDSEQFAAWLLEVGAGTNADDTGTIQIPPNMLCDGNSMESLISSVYPGIAYGDKDDQYFVDRTLLSGANNDVDDINSAILAKFPGEMVVLHGADSVIMEDEADNPYPIEYLNSLRASGLPLAKLALKPGVSIMLLWNLDPARGLCNGTQLRLLEIRPWCLKCRIISGDMRFAGNVEFIPRITLEPSEESLPVALKRHQFPV
jgi:hypothetical protein